MLPKFDLCSQNWRQHFSTHLLTFVSDYTVRLGAAICNASCYAISHASGIIYANAMLKYNIATYRLVCILNIIHVYNMLLHMPRAVPNSAVKKRTPKLAPSISPRIPTHLSTLSAILVCMSPKQAISRFSCIVDQGKVPTLQLLRRSHPWDRTERCSSMKWSEYMSPHKIPKMKSVSFDEGDHSALQWSGLQWTCAPVQVDCTSELVPQWIARWKRLLSASARLSHLPSGGGRNLHMGYACHHHHPDPHGGGDSGPLAW